MPLMRIDEATVSPPQAGPPLFALGFRPFYLLGAALSGTVTAAMALAAAAARALRLAGWQPWRTWRKPLLWDPAPVACVDSARFRPAGAALCGIVGESAALHGLTVGALAGPIIAMITRMALGRIGRPLRTARAGTLMFVLLLMAVLVRCCAAIRPA